MKKLVAAILLICIVSSFSSCTETEAGVPAVYDLSAEAKIETAEKDLLSVDDVRAIINKAVEICENNDAVKVDSNTTVYKRDISKIDLEFVKTLTPSNFSDHFEVYREQLNNIKEVAIQMLMDYFPEDNSIAIDVPPYVNSLPPTHIFYIQESEDPAKEIKVVAWQGDLYYHEGEAEPVLLYPTPELAEIEAHFWDLNRQSGRPIVQ